MKRHRQVHFRVSEKEYEWLTGTAEVAGESIASLMRRLLREQRMRDSSQTRDGADDRPHWRMRTPP